MKLLIIDNYDSFTYNLVQYFMTIKDIEVSVFRNDQIALASVANYDAIVLSPGPGLPKDAGIMPALIDQYKNEKPILGICLGEQAIAEAFGGSLYNLEKVFHGVETKVKVLDEEEPMFKELSVPFMAGRYHSWAVSKEDFPDCLTITAEDEKGVIMALRHKEFEISGLQFHPESIMTEVGLDIIKNWVKSVQQKLSNQVQI